MTRQFKFGDRVRHSKYGECMVVTQWYDTDTEDPTWVSIISEVHGECDARHEELELIPHPDTVRLDWIQNNFYDIFAYDEHNYFRINRTIKEEDVFDGEPYKYVREAIDNAMQQEQTK